MNNLVFRDPIQRFKDGKKIERFQAGSQSQAYNRRVDANRIYNVGLGNFPEVVVTGDKNKRIYNVGLGNFPEVVVTGDKNKQNKSKKTNTTVQQQKASPAASTKKSGISFKNAFNQARNSKQQEFTWNGKKYNTMKTGETKEQWLANLEKQPDVQRLELSPEKQPDIQRLELYPGILPISTPKMSVSIPNVEIPQYLNFNRSQVRQLMRNQGYNPYDFTGAQRKALRMYLAGKSTDISKLDGIDLSKFRF